MVWQRSQTSFARISMRLPLQIWQTRAHDVPEELSASCETDGTLVAETVLLCFCIGSRPGNENEADRGAAGGNVVFVGNEGKLVVGVGALDRQIERRRREVRDANE